MQASWKRAPSRVRVPFVICCPDVHGFVCKESRSSEMERKEGGKFHLKLNMCWRPIVNKYHEGKVKRTLKRELNVPEIAEREAKGTSVCGQIAG